MLTVDAQVHIWEHGLPTNPAHRQIPRFSKDDLLKEMDAAGVLKLGHISLDGTKMHADAAKSHAISYKRLLEREHQWRAEVDELFALNEQAEGAPTLDTLPAALGTPSAGALDTGYFSAANIAALEQRGIEPYSAVGRQPHHQHWSAYCAQPPAPPPDDASPLVTMAYTLRTEMGQAIYRLRKCTVEPVLGIIKEVLGFRQCSLRGLAAAAGEWCLVCLAFNLKRLHVLCVA
jgi:hypothetical protein